MKSPTSLYGLHKPFYNKDISTPQITPARVKAIILDDKKYPDQFKEFGGWDSIGTIFFESVNRPNPSNNPITNPIAKPLFPNVKNYPLENEIVYIISFPNNNIQSNVNSPSLYYFNPINLWNSPHHNAIPDSIYSNNIPENQKRDYEQVEGGSVRRVSDGSTEIKLGDTFKERLNVRNTQPYEGDVIYEGRWGQSIRFGSTIKNSNIFNPWSENGEDGDPITIITNDQFDENTDPWVPQTEDVNKNKTSIYLTSNQKLPIEVSSNNYNSYEEKPISPKEYTTPQLILNSGRLLFNSFDDSILFSSKKTINLNSQNSVNIDSPKTIISSDDIRLGNKNSSEPIILGNKFLRDLQQLAVSLYSLGAALETSPIGAGPPNIINSAIPPLGANVKNYSKRIIDNIENYKSKVSFSD